MTPDQDHFRLVSDFEVSGDQVRAIPELVEGLRRGHPLDRQRPIALLDEERLRRLDDRAM